MRLLEEFWYGNIEPTEYDTSSKEYKKLQELICRNEEKQGAVQNCSLLNFFGISRAQQLQQRASSARRW